MEITVAWPHSSGTARISVFFRIKLSIKTSSTLFRSESWQDKRSCIAPQARTIVKKQHKKVALGLHQRRYVICPNAWETGNEEWMHVLFCGDFYVTIVSRRKQNRVKCCKISLSVFSLFFVCLFVCFCFFVFCFCLAVRISRLLWLTQYNSNMA